MKIVGFQRSDYPEQRNILCLNTDKVQFELLQCGPIPEWLSDGAVRSNFFPDYALAPMPSDRVSCSHFFNSIPVNDIPFVTTFETSVPRWWGVDDSVSRYGWSVLASENCRQLFAISKNAISIFYDSLRWCPEEYREAVRRKTQLLYPPQQLFALNEESVHCERPRLAFIGGDLLRKGGLEFLEAYDSVNSSGGDLSLTIVTELRIQGSADLGWNVDGKLRLARCEEILDRWADRVIHHRSLPNAEVLKLLRSCHVGVLPSFGDTFGYFVLEAQANGLPMITSNLRAFPELNDNHLGWIVDLPVDEFGKLNPKVRFEDMSHSVTVRLRNCLSEVANMSPVDLMTKGKRGRDRVALYHDPVKVADTLFTWY